MRSDGLANRICTKATAWNRYRSEWAEGTSQIYFFSRPAPKLRERRWRRQLYAIRDRLDGNPLKPDTATRIDWNVGDHRICGAVDYGDATVRRILAAARSVDASSGVCSDGECLRRGHLGDNAISRRSAQADVMRLFGGTPNIRGAAGNWVSGQPGLCRGLECANTQQDNGSRCNSA